MNGRPEHLLPEEAAFHLVTVQQIESDPSLTSLFLKDYLFLQTRMRRKDYPANLLVSWIS